MLEFDGVFECDSVAPVGVGAEVVVAKHRVVADVRDIDIDRPHVAERHTSQHDVFHVAGGRIKGDPAVLLQIDLRPVVPG